MIEDGMYLWERDCGDKEPVLVANGFFHEPRHDGIPVSELEGLKLTRLVPVTNDTQPAGEMQPLPCPHCATTPHPKDHARWEAEITEYAIRCPNCGAFGPNDISLDRAREMWNLRRVDSAERTTLQQENARLAAELEERNIALGELYGDRNNLRLELAALRAEAKRWTPTVNVETGQLTVGDPVVDEWLTPEEDAAWAHLQDTPAQEGSE